MTKVLLVRHGETEIGRTRHLCGVTDEPLNTRGLRQAELLAGRLSEMRLAALYASGLQRAWVTAGRVASSRQMEVAASPEMRELDFGKCEGLTFDQVKERYPEVARLWLSRSPDLRYPEGESLEHFVRRVTSFGARLREHKGSDSVLLVAHLGSLRVLLCHLLGISWQHWWQFQLDNASITVIEMHPNGISPEDRRGMLLSLNDTSHLNGLGVSARE